MSENGATVDPSASEPVRVPGASRGDGGIVVGVDGSPGSLAALEWGLAEAKLRGVTTLAVFAWQPPEFYPAQNAWTPRIGPSGETAKQLADEATAEITRIGEDAAGRHGVKIRCEAVEGHPAEALIRTGQDAAMLVVGSRGHGGFAGVLLGSVSQHVVAHARCPVVIVPDPGREGLRS
ncbi:MULTISPECIES: universal stress protein [unclassified Arthrobacter]|uniref:universal stress protein n=1 Tax=unclassified Arthrobacter TaxID=235627 RepID=UPI003397301D